MSLLHQAFIKSAKKQPSKIAVYDEMTGRSYSYQSLLIISLLFSRRVKEFDEEKYIGVMLPTSAAVIFVKLSLLFAGKVPVMINYATGAEQNSKYAQETCKFKTIITSKGLLEKRNIAFIEGMFFIEDFVKSIDYIQKLFGVFLATFCEHFVHFGSEHDDAVILFTSGSEKDPKAVMLTHKNLASNVASIRDALLLSSDDRFVAILPYFHIFGLTTALWTPLTIGASIITYANPLDYSKIASIIKDKEGSIFITTPTFLSGVLKKSHSGDFESLRIIVSGADKLPKELREEFYRVHHKEVLEGYGATETSPVVSVNRPGASTPGSIGQLLSGVQVRIVNLENGKDVPRGEEGKILVKGDLVMKGYLDNQEETARVIVDGWYDTGDVGIYDDNGFLWHRGRYKRFVKIGGEMISLVALENMIEEVLPSGVLCSVVDIPHKVKGAEIVLVTTKILSDVEKTHIIEELIKHFSNIALPKHFVVIEEMPLMGSGKINFREVGKIVKGMICYGN